MFTSLLFCFEENQYLLCVGGIFEKCLLFDMSMSMSFFPAPTGSTDIADGGVRTLAEFRADTGYIGILVGLPL